MEMSVIDELFKESYSQVIRKTRHKSKIFAYDLVQDAYRKNKHTFLLIFIIRKTDI